MSKRSTVTVREQPLATAASARGTFEVHADTMAVTTEARLQILDLTDRIMAMVPGLGVREGLLNVFSMHTTCTLFVNEHQRALVEDFERYLAQIVPADLRWLHNDPAHSDCDRGNAVAHLQSLHLGHSLTLPVSGGQVVLGRWQRILMAELDGPRSRSLRVQVMGAR